MICHWLKFKFCRLATILMNLVRAMIMNTDVLITTSDRIQKTTMSMIKYTSS